MVAAAQGHAATVNALCEAGAQVDYARPANGFTALMAAGATSQDATCANILLQHHATVGLPDKQGCDALMHAAWHGNHLACQVRPLPASPCFPLVSPWHLP